MMRCTFPQKRQFLNWLADLMKFNFFEGWGPFIINCLSQLLVNIWKRCFKFHHKQAMNEEFYFWGCKIFGGSKGGKVARFRKILMQNVGLNPQLKFQHSSWIRKHSKIGESWVGGFRPPHRGWRIQFQKFLIQNSDPILQPKFHHPSSIRNSCKQIEYVKLFKFVTRVCNPENGSWVLNSSSLGFVLCP